MIGFTKDHSRFVALTLFATLFAVMATGCVTPAGVSATTTLPNSTSTPTDYLPITGFTTWVETTTAAPDSDTLVPYTTTPTVSTTEAATASATGTGSAGATALFTQDVVLAEIFMAEW